MKKQMKVTFKGIDHSDEIESECIKHFAKIEQLTDRITSCHIVVSARQSDRSRNEFHNYHLTLHVPGTEIVVTHDAEEIHSKEDDHRALRDTFDRARHRLDEFMERRRERSRG